MSDCVDLLAVALEMLSARITDDDLLEEIISVFRDLSLGSEADVRFVVPVAEDFVIGYDDNGRIAFVPFRWVK